MITLSIGDKRLGAELIDLGYISDEGMEQVLARYGDQRGGLLDAILDLGLLSEVQLAEVVERVFGIPLVELEQIEVPPEVEALLPAEKAQELRAIPIGRDGNTLRLAMANPLDTYASQDLEDLTGLELELYLTRRSTFQAQLGRHYPELGLQTPAPSEAASSRELQLGELLVQEGLITSADMERVLEIQSQTGGLVGSILQREGLITKDQLGKALAEQAGVEYIPDVYPLQRSYRPDRRFSRQEAIRQRVIPLLDASDELLLVASDPKAVRELPRELAEESVVLTHPGGWDSLLRWAYPENENSGNAVRQAGLKDPALSKTRGGANSLGEALVELGFVSEEKVKEVIAQQRAGQGKLEKILLDTKQVTGAQLARALAYQLDVPFIDPQDDPPEPRVLNLVPGATLRSYTVFPHRIDDDNNLIVLMSDPRNITASDDLRIITGYNIVPVVAPVEEITKLIQRHFENRGNVEAVRREYRLKEKDNSERQQIVHAAPVIDDNAVVRLINGVIRDAFLNEASDIHIEALPNEVRIRVRRDGVLEEHTRLPKESLSAVIARVKIMGRLKVDEKRLPQDGRIHYQDPNDKNIDLDMRLSTLPTINGEKAVMRILPKERRIPQIENLGFAPDTLERFKRIINSSYGIFLTTGPTGSGKTTTNFSILNRIATVDRNTTTIEDPIEYELAGVNQTQVNVQAGLTFATALRAFLRQDPDIIMVGEIRDAETAKIAVEAALTGHLVLATLHTNDAATAVTRLDEMGVELFNIAGSVLGVLAQRLARRICDRCKEEIEPDIKILSYLGLKESDMEGRKLYRGKGCNRCLHTGYRGRIGIHELMTIDDDLRDLIVKRKPALEIKEMARKKGMRTLREDGIYKALKGDTTLEEVLARTM